MALLNIGIGLNFSNGAVNSLVGDIKRVNSEAVSLGNSFAGVKEKINLLEKMQGFAAVSNVVRNTSSAVKDLFVCVKSSFKDVFDFVGGYASTGDKIAKTSRLVGLSVKDYQAFASAANHAGLSTEEMDSALNLIGALFEPGENDSISSMQEIALSLFFVSSLAIILSPLRLPMIPRWLEIRTT